MKPPDWLVIQPPRKGVLASDGKSVWFTARIRLWHPGFWLAALRYWWAHR